MVARVDGEPCGGYLASVKLMMASTSKAGSPPACSYRIADERLVKLTENAARKVVSLLSRQGRLHGVLRVAVIGGGCSGMQYKMDLQDGPAARDFLVESSGVKVVVDPKSALYVSGANWITWRPWRTGDSRSRIRTRRRVVPAVRVLAPDDAWRGGKSSSPSRPRVW